MFLRINRSAGSIAVLCCGLLTWGCESRAGSDRHESHGPSATAVSSQGRQQAVSLSGCVELSGTAIGGYVLQRLHIEGQDGQDPQRTSTYPPTGIVEGSWVRLTGARDLPTLAGRRVLISGLIVDTGWNAVGTTSVSGTAPEVKVTEIKDLGEGCHQERQRR